MHSAWFSLGCGLSIGWPGRNLANENPIENSSHPSWPLLMRNGLLGNVLLLLQQRPPLSWSLPRRQLLQLAACPPLAVAAVAVEVAAEHPPRRRLLQLAACQPLVRQSQQRRLRLAQQAAPAEFAVAVVVAVAMGPAVAAGPSRTHGVHRIPFVLSQLA